MLRLDTTAARSLIDGTSLEALRPRVEAAHTAVLEKTGAGNQFLGWRDLLLEPDEHLLNEIESVAATVRQHADVFVCIGIGGSYLGAAAVIQALTPYFRQGDASTEVMFAGHHMSGAYLRELLHTLEGKSVYLNVISKSGTTLEPALAFRFLRQWMETTFDDADDRIIVTTDPSRGALNALREEHDYQKFVIPPDVGGRFSVLTPVGLLPIAVAGIDVRALFQGAAAACDRFTDAGDNPALEYAALRYLLYEDDYDVEALAVFEPRLRGIGAWWQQLFGESEGKDGKGLYPATLQYSTDLHSLGQYLQDGQRNVIETFLMIDDDPVELTVPRSEDDLDGLNYLAGKTMHEINEGAYEGTATAHASGGVPTMTIRLDRLDAGALGECLYFFEHAVAVSGYLLGVNPFDQPGVEAYKKEMFNRLGRP